MPRSKTANENSPGAVGADDRQTKVDMIAHHMAILGPKHMAVAAVKADVDEIIAEAKERLSEAQQQLTDAYHEAKADTRLDREVLERGLKAQKSGARKAIRDREEWDLVCEAAGIPIQLDLLGTATTPTLTKDALAWEAEGYLAGRRADGAPEAPKGCTGDNLQAFMRGYHKGQEENGRALGRAKSVIEARATPSVEPPVDLNSDEGQEVIDDAAKKLKKSDFMKTGGDDAGAQASAA